MDRRAVLAGLAATAALWRVPIGSAAASEQWMRQRLVTRVEWARDTSVMLDGFDWVRPWIKKDARYLHAFAERELAEFERGEGIWHALARQHPEGVSDRLHAEVRADRQLRSRVDILSRLKEEHPYSISLQDELREAVDELAEFERGEGRLRRLVDHWPNDV